MFTDNLARLHQLAVALHTASDAAQARLAQPLAATETTEDRAAVVLNQLSSTVIDAALDARSAAGQFDGHLLALAADAWLAQGGAA